MAYQEPYPPPLPHHPSDPRFLHPQSQYGASSNNMPDLEQMRSRDAVAQDGYTSDSSRYSRARQPINEAVNSAFTNSTVTSNAIAPELLAQLTSQITANVIQHLKASNISAPGTSPSIQPDKSSAGGSPPIDRASVYTPPSPYPAPEQRSPEKPAGLGVNMPNGASPPPRDKTTSPSFSRASIDDDPAVRPKGPQRISTSGDMTVVEKIWGTLFSEQGEATPRLGQFLRGIAMHLIKDYEPQNSLVVTPAKMQRYYEETKLDSELYPWHHIFDDRTSSISRMLRELEISHHLVQSKLNERPEIPGLTPEGFERWYTLMICAHPDQEYQRLAKTALEMPINNPDDRKERFPKELSRRLFPGRGDDEVEATLCKNMSRYCNLNLRSRTNSTTQDLRPEPEPRPSVASVRSNGVIAPEPVSADRPQSFSSAASGAAVVSDSEDTPTPQPIERERKPYSAQPGGGKTFENVNAPAVPASATELKPPPTEYSKLRRSSSTRESRSARADDLSSKPRPAPISIHQTQASAATTAPLEIPESHRRHRNSAYYRDNPPSAAGPRRARSPSANNDARSSNRHLDPTDLFNAFAREPDDREKRYREWETGRERLAGDRFDAARMSAYDPRDRERERGGYESRPRGQSMAGYAPGDDEYYRSTGSYQPPPERERVRDAGASVSGPSGGAGSYAGGAGSAYPPNSYRDGR